MNKKTIIQVSIVVFCFGMSGIVIYRGLFSTKKSVTVPPPALTVPAGSATPSAPASGPSKTGPSAGAVSTVNSTAQANEPILPYGKNWDLQKVLAKQTLQYGIVQYPQLDPNSDVGLNVSDLFTSLTVGK